MNFTGHFAIAHLTMDLKVRGSNPCGRTSGFNLKLPTLWFLVTQFFKNWCKVMFG